MPKVNKPNVGQIVKAGLCTSCGVCKGICAKHSISFDYGNERNEPVVDSQSCINCGLCYEVWPGKGVALNAKGEKLFAEEDKALFNRYCGYYLGSYTGYSANKDIRFHSASGGMVTSFLIFLLEKKIIDGAVVVGFKEDNPFEPEPFIATTKDEILRSRGSKYLVLSYDKIVDKIESFPGKLVVVGLPCQIQGLRNLSEKNKHVREHVIGFFSIYCSLNKTKHSMNYYLDKYKIKIDEVGYFSFRDDGCLGYMKYVSKNGNVIKKIPYLSFWFGSHSFFQNKRCLLCADHFGELADISFGDINIEPFNEDKIGINSIVSRSTFWDSLLNQCKREGVIVLNNCNIEQVLKSQGYSKRHKKGIGIQAFLNYRKVLGKTNPVYDVEFEGKPTLKSYVGVVVKQIMLWVGSHKLYWPIIKALDRSEKSAIV